MDGTEEKKRLLLGRMQALCAKREYCETDIRKKLFKALGSEDGAYPDAGAWEDLVDEIVMSLKRDSFIDDFRYCRAFARDKSSISGWGRQKIRHTLAAKGIARECIAAGIEETDTDAGLEKLRKALAAKSVSLQGDPYARFKLLRFALNRGFEYGEVNDIVDEVLGSEGDRFDK